MTSVKRIADVVDREVYKKARLDLLAMEKETTKMMAKVAEARRKLPFVEVDRDYVFEGPDGDTKLSALFEGDKDLVVYHFMYDEGWDKGCSSCSMWNDGFNGVYRQLHSKITLVSIAPVGYEKLGAFAKAKGYDIPFLSDKTREFGRDYKVLFSKEDADAKASKYNFGRPVFATTMPGVSVFRKGPDGKVYHTYSGYARGLEVLCPVWGFLDLLPDGRQEASPMDFVKHKEEY